MKYYVIQHDHGHGTDLFYVQSKRDLTIKDAEDYVGDDYDPDCFEESLEIHLVETWTTIS